MELLELREALLLVAAAGAAASARCLSAASCETCFGPPCDQSAAANRLASATEGWLASGAAHTRTTWH